MRPNAALGNSEASIRNSWTWRLCRPPSRLPTSVREASVAASGRPATVATEVRRRLCLRVGHVPLRFYTLGHRPR